MILTIVAAATEGADPSRYLDALASDGILDDDAVEVWIVQGQSGPVQNPPDGVNLQSLGATVSIFELWGAGIRLASADAIALMDIRCPPRRGWLNAVRNALPLSGSAVFGPVACGMQQNDPHIVGYLTEYVQFDPPLDPQSDEVPGVNLVAARSLVTHPRVLGEDGFVKTRFLALLSELNAPRPEAIAGAVVDYQKCYGPGQYALHRFRHARCYAAQRPLPSFAAWLLAVLATPCLPFVRSLRIHRSAKRSRSRAIAARQYWLRILVAEAAWSFGEFLGYTLGEGRARQRLR